MKKVSCRTVDIYHTLLLLIFGGLNFHDFGDYKEIAKSKVRENKLPCGGGGGELLLSEPTVTVFYLSFVENWVEQCSVQRKMPDRVGCHSCQRPPLRS